MSDDPIDDRPEAVGESEIRALVADAETIRNSLDRLVELAKTDAGHAFRPEVLEALATLKSEDRPSFEALRSELRKAGIRVAELDKLLDDQLELFPLRRFETKHSLGGDLASSLDKMDLFHSPSSEAYADFPVDGHRETICIDSRRFRDRLTQIYFNEYRELPSAEELRGVVDLARARATFEGPERRVHVRVAEADDVFFIDLGDPKWRAVEVTREGWRVISDPPVRFVRSAGHLALPEPQRGGSIAMLRKHVNLAEESAVLAVMWLLAALRPVGPYPILAVNGEQGSAKTTLSRCLRALVDPNSVPLRTLPKSEHDLMISATRAHLLAFDNISGISGAMSDALCRVATGGGFATRTLHTTADETLLQAERPVLINGIDDIIARPDLADRTIVLELERIEPGRRRPAELIDRDFEADRPLILGVLLDAMVHGLRNLEAVSETNLPRMAGSARWMLACEGAFWLEGTVSEALELSGRAGVDRLVERTPLVGAMAAFMARTPHWEGTATQLLPQLARLVDDGTRRSRNWPQEPARLGALLVRVRPLLRELGIEVGGGPRGHERKRVIVLSRLPSGITGEVQDDREQAADDATGTE